MTCAPSQLAGRLVADGPGGEQAGAKVPTVADLRARRLELTRASLRETLVQGELEPFRVIESLADEFDLVAVAMAAVKLAHEAAGLDTAEEDIPEVAPAGCPAGVRPGSLPR